MHVVRFLSLCLVPGEKRRRSGGQSGGVSVALSRPSWSSFLLALGCDIAISVALPGEAAPATPNLLQLHRAMNQASWPVPVAGQPALPPPVVFADTRFGSRIYIRQAYEWMLAELPLAKMERATVQHGLAAMGVAVLGNAGIGKVSPSVHISLMGMLCS
jgi:hypothetical protein